MPTECERNIVATPGQQQIQPQPQPHEQEQHQQHQQHEHQQQTQEEHYQQQLHLQQQQQEMELANNMDEKEMNNEMSTSQTSTTSSNGHNGTSANGSGKKTSLISPDPTPYVAKARITRPTPPPPSYNPMQFVQIKPCNLYQTAQEQLKKAEEVKKIKEIKKEEPEDWQNNLDNWKSSRRKRVEHIIDRVVEVKKLELEEHDRTRRKSKTFSEMIEERGERGARGLTKLASLAVYNEDESNDFSDLGIGTSSASGKSSLSEDYDNNSVMSDNAELNKALSENNHQQSNKLRREYISSPGYDTSSSTAPASSPDPCEYTYEGAIQDYKQRVSRASSGGNGSNYKQHNNDNNNGTTNHNGGNGGNGNNNNNTKLLQRANTTPATTSAVASTSKESTPERGGNNGHATELYPTRRGSKIEDRLIGFEVTSPSDSQDVVEKIKVDVPKIDISKRKEMFENQRSLSTGSGISSGNNEPKPLSNGGGGGGVPRVQLRERFKLDATATSGSEAADAARKEVKRLSGDITSIRARMQSLEQQNSTVNATNGGVKSATPKIVDIPVPPLKERLSSLQNAVTKEEVKKPPVSLIDERQLEIMRSEEESAKQRMKQFEAQDQQRIQKEQKPQQIKQETKIIEPENEPDRDDSGIHTADDIEPQELETRNMEQQLKEQEQQLNAAIAALAMEERQLEEAANAVNKIEAEFAELSNVAANEPPCDMEFSINEALELALEAIDKETKLAKREETKTKEKLQKQQQQQKQQHQIKIKSQKDLNKSAEEKEIENHNQSLNQNQNHNQNSNNNNQKKLTKTTATTNNSLTMCENEDYTSNNQKIQKQNQMNKEAIIANEPIYENINNITAAVTLTAAVTATALNNVKQTALAQDNDEAVTAALGTENIIPNIIKDNNFNNHKHNHNKLIKTNNNNNKNNNNFIELTKNAFANNTTAATSTATTNDIATTLNTKPAILTSTASITTTTTTTTTKTTNKATTLEQPLPIQQSPTTTTNTFSASDIEPYYQVPKSMEPYYDAPKHSRPIPVYENIEVFYTGLENSTIIAASTTTIVGGGSFQLEPPKEKPPPPPTESPPPLPPTTKAFNNNQHPEADTESVTDNADTWSSDNTYETISTRRLSQSALASADQPSPPIKRMNSTKRIKKELRNKRSSFLGIESAADDEETYLELTVAPPPDMAQLLQEERRLEKQLYMKAGLCDSSDTGESRDSGVSENHSRQSSEHYTNSSEENDRHVDSPPMLTQSTEFIYQNEALLTAAQTPLLQTVKGNSAESWTESATAAAAATKSLTEATATANAKMLSIEEKIREQEEVLRVERELLQLEQEELKRQRENLMLRENMARRELQHGAKMLMSANRRSLQDLNGANGVVGVVGLSVATNGHHILTQQQQSQLQQQQVQLPPQQIYANVPNLQQQQPLQLSQQQFYHQVETDYRKSMSDLNEFSKRLIVPPAPPTKPMRTMHVTTNGHGEDITARQRHSLNTQSYGGSLVKIAAPTAAPRSHIYSNYHHQSAQNLSSVPHPHQHSHHGNMSRNALHALSATPKPKYTDGWVQVQNRKSYDTANLANDPAWLSAYQQKRKSMPDAYQAYNNHWLVQEAEQRRLAEQQRISLSSGNTPVHLHNGNSTSNATVTPNSNGKPLPDSIIQTLTERVQSKGIGERKRFDNYSTINNNSNTEKSPLHAATSTAHISSPYHQHQHQKQQSTSSSVSSQQKSQQHRQPSETINIQPNQSLPQQPPPTLPTSAANATQPDKVLSVSGKKKCSHCGDELGRGAAMIIESLLLFYHINCFKCCVCHVQLGDGLNGTDVRVRNHKLHCQNCYSSDDGIKFSCV